MQEEYDDGDNPMLESHPSRKLSDNWLYGQDGNLIENKEYKALSGRNSPKLIGSSANLREEVP